MALLALVNSFASGYTPEDINLFLWDWDAVDQLLFGKPNVATVLHRDDLPNSNVSWQLKSQP